MMNNFFRFHNNGIIQKQNSILRLHLLADSVSLLKVSFRPLMDLTWLWIWTGLDTYRRSGELVEVGEMASLQSSDIWIQP